MSTLPNTALDHRASRRQLWFGLLGGAAAWLVHFFTAYAAAEFGCVSGWGKQQWAGISLVSWLVLGVTAITLALSIAAAWIAYRVHQRTGASETNSQSTQRGEAYLAHAGVLTSGIFIVVILFETIPVFFYLQRC